MLSCQTHWIPSLWIFHVTSSCCLGLIQSVRVVQGKSKMYWNIRTIIFIRKTLGKEWPTFFHSLPDNDKISCIKIGRISISQAFPWIWSSFLHKSLDRPKILMRNYCLIIKLKRHSVKNFEVKIWNQSKLCIFYKCKTSRDLIRDFLHEQLWFSYSGMHDSDTIFR